MSGIMKATLLLSRRRAANCFRRAAPSIFGCPNSQTKRDFYWIILGEARMDDLSHSLHYESRSGHSLIDRNGQSSGNPTLDLDEDLVQDTSNLVRALGDPSHDLDDEATKLLSTNFKEIDRILEAWSKAAGNAAETSQYVGMDAAIQAESLLVALEQNMDSDREHGKHLIPDTVSYNKVLHAYATCAGGKDAALRAHSILTRMLTTCRDYAQDANEFKVKPPEPTARTFNIVINAWAKSGEPDAGTRAEEVFTMMETWARDCKEQFASVYVGDLPNSRSLSGVLDCWAQTKSLYAAERATVILEHAIEGRRDRVFNRNVVDGATVIKPGVVAFNSVVHAWVNSGQGQYAAVKAEEILKMMESLDESKELGSDTGDADDIGIKPNTRTMSLILDAWAQCRDSSGNAAMRAQHILEHMEKLHADGYDVKPNYVSFTTCIKAWSRSTNVRDAAERAEALLDRLIQLHQTSGDDDLKPTSVTGNAVITAWARSRHPNSAYRAKSLLQKIERFSSLDSYSYNAVLDALAKQGDSRTAKKILDQMEAAYKRGNEKAKPDIISYNSVLNALAKRRRRRNDAASTAREFVTRMEDTYRRGRTTVRPDAHSYTSVIECWSRTDNPRQFVNASEVLKHMIEEYRKGNESAKPDAFAFGRVINACARTQWMSEEQRRGALTTALRTFEELQQSPEFGKPQSRTFSILLAACFRLTCDYYERIELLEAVFQGCCDAGKVDRAILEQAHHEMPNALRKNLLGTIRSEWSENVPESDKP